MINVIVRGMGTGGTSSLGQYWREKFAHDLAGNPSGHISTPDISTRHITNVKYVPLFRWSDSPKDIVSSYLFPLNALSLQHQCNSNTHKSNRQSSISSHTTRTTLPSTPTSITTINNPLPILHRLDRDDTLGRKRRALVNARPRTSITRSIHLTRRRVLCNLGKFGSEKPLILALSGRQYVVY